MVEEAWRAVGYGAGIETRAARIRSELRPERCGADCVRVHRLAATVHDVAKPLAVIQIHARELARGSIPPERLRAVAEDLFALSRDALALLEDCAAALRRSPVGPDAGGASEERLEETLEEVLEQARETVLRLHPGRLLEIRARCALELAIRRPRELAAALVNLVDNAVQASGPHESVRIEVGWESADAEAEWLRITVQDRGCGMPESVRRRATEAYFSTRPGSMGLGLPSARARVESLGGSLELESQPGVGTRALVRLPFAAGTARRS
jgi:signal transduction histidine kinase